MAIGVSAGLASRVLPTGVVALLFSDIEGSTKLLERLGDRYVDVLANHHRLVRAAVAAHHGDEVDTEGDAFFVVFRSAREAIAAGVDVQRALRREPRLRPAQEAARLHGAALKMRVAMADRLGIAESLMGAAAVVVARDAPAAARLVGAAERLRRACQAVPTPRQVA